MSEEQARTRVMLHHSQRRDDWGWSEHARPVAGAKRARPHDTIAGLIVWCDRDEPFPARRAQP